MKPKILVRRIRPGLGDIICSTVAMRAATEKYGDDFEVHASFGLRAWCELFADQNVAHQVVSHHYCRLSDERLAAEYDHVFELDGPEFRHANHINWAPMNRTEVWCDSVDHRPADMCPHWGCPYPENLKHEQWLFENIPPFSRTRGDKLIVVQARPCMGMPWKHWPHMPLLVAELAKQYHVLVLNDLPVPEYAEPNGYVFAYDLPLRRLGHVLECADLVIAPDSAFIHFAAAVGTGCLGLFGGTDGAVTTRNYPKCQFIQAPIDPNWNCSGKDQAPCHGMATRAFWCGSRDFNSMGACMERITVQQVAERARIILEAMH